MFCADIVFCYICAKYFPIDKTIMDNILKYKDFICTVNFSAEGGVFYGKIEGIKSMRDRTRPRRRLQDCR